jgi:hypothetical protein
MRVEKDHQVVPDELRLLRVDWLVGSRLELLREPATVVGRRKRRDGTKCGLVRLVAGWAWTQHARNIM